MTQEEIERLKQDAQGVNIGTYVASGAINIQKIENVERLYPGSIDKLHDLVKKEAIKSRKLTDDELRYIINRVMSKIKKNRHWFCVIKPLMLYGQFVNDDWDAAKTRIESLYPAGLKTTIDTSDLQAMHTGSFEDPIKDWKVGDGPFQRDAEFKVYLNLAKEVESLIKAILSTSQE